jgi:hypothetical protein
MLAVRTWGTWLFELDFHFPASIPLKPCSSVDSEVVLGLEAQTWDTRHAVIDPNKRAHWQISSFASCQSMS